VLDFGLEDRTPYLVMDYAPGGTLRTRHPKGSRLPLPTIVEYVKQIAQALQHAHTTSSSTATSSRKTCSSVVRERCCSATLASP
jgi:serine/threonine protein kinase